MNNLMKRIAVGGLVATSVSVALATNWTGGGSTEVFDPANWGGVTMDSTYDATFYNISNPLSLIMSADATVKRVYFNNATVDVDLKGNTLAWTGGDMQVSNGAKPTLSNGTLKQSSGTLRVGQDGKNSIITLTGAEMSAKFTALLIGQNNGASFNGLVVQDGAYCYSGNGLPVANTHNNVSNNYFWVKGEGSQIDVAANTVVTIGHQGIGGNNWAKASDHGLVTCTKTLLGNQIDCPNNTLYIQGYGMYTNNGDVSIGAVAGSNGNRIMAEDNGILYVKDNFYISSSGATNNELVVDHTEATVGKQIFISGNSASRKSGVRVLNGATLSTGTGFRVGWGVESDENYVIISNATMQTPGILVGRNLASVTNDNRIVFAGTNSTWTVTGGDISLKSGAILEVNLPKGGRVADVTCLTGTSASLNHDGTMRILINAKDCARNLTAPVTYPLVRVKNQIASGAIDNVTTDLDSKHVTVAFTSDKKGIDLTVKPWQPGLKVMVR